MDIKFFACHINHLFTLYIIFPCVLFLGIYLTFKLKFIQISKLKLSLQFLIRKEERQKGSISQYQAVAAVLAGNFGAGNIPGMAVAISAGGPGALVWMWIMAFLGASIQYASCLLGGKFSKINEENEQVGGPMYYLSDGLGYKRLAILFSFFTILGSVTVGNVAQVNSILLPLNEAGIPPYISLGVIAILTGAVILGGVHRFAKVASSLVPIMALLYLTATSIILVLNSDKILPAFKLMFTYAFDFSSVLGGTLGFGVLKAISTGFDRGLFATDAGTGLVPILQSSARSKHPAIYGIVTLITPFLVMTVCTGTGLILIITGAWLDKNLVSTNMVTHAFGKGLDNVIGPYIVIIALVMFAYTTILAWANCGEKAVSFMWGLKHVNRFRYFYISLIPLAWFLPVDVVWALSDISISLMLVTNLIGVTLLSKHVIKDSRDYFALESQSELALETN